MQTDFADPIVGGSLTDPSIDNDVKMVIWDLDDTFWNGTLAEGGAEFIESNAEIVRALAARGIISSIASKNNYEAARKILEQAGVWDYFVFPSISFAPKGERVSEIIRNASLRAENVLFVDDNIGNLEEARFYNPGIMLAQPGEIIPHLLDHPRLTGKADPDLKRLKQYQLLQRKFVDQSSTALSNNDFLRSSKIEIRFDFDIESNFDRVLDLVNRANQLNYTKKRLQSKGDIDQFRLSLNEYGVAAGCISCSDRYGDYGIIGFFMLKRRKHSELIHFVFSCRTMNMGIEQFVYVYLGRPDITIVPEVAYGLDDGKQIDWITLAKSVAERHSLIANDRKLLLIGGCELQQLASYCSSNRTEFVNASRIRPGDGTFARYDDPSFITASRAALRGNGELQSLSGWTHEDALLLDQNIATADIILLAMRAVLRHLYVVAKENIYVRMQQSTIQSYLLKNPNWFRRNFTIVKLGMHDRLDLIREAFETVRDRSRRDAVIFVLGANTRGNFDPQDLSTSRLYNDFCETFCHENAEKLDFVDADKIVSEKFLVDSDHFVPAGYHALSIYINAKFEEMSHRLQRD